MRLWVRFSFQNCQETELNYLWIRACTVCPHHQTPKGRSFSWAQTWACGGWLPSASCHTAYKGIFITWMFPVVLHGVLLKRWKPGQPFDLPAASQRLHSGSQRLITVCTQLCTVTAAACCLHPKLGQQPSSRKELRHGTPQTSLVGMPSNEMHFPARDYHSPAPFLFHYPWHL